jgi:hypothetical protein
MPSHRYLHVPLLEAISFANDVPIAAALNAMHMSQDLYVVESEDDMFIAGAVGCPHQTAAYSP